MVMGQRENWVGLVAFS